MPLQLGCQSRRNCYELLNILFEFFLYSLIKIKVGNDNIYVVAIDDSALLLANLTARTKFK